MAERIIRLGPGECSEVEIGARYFAALAFPGVGEENARQEAIIGWVGSYLHEANRVDESDDPFEDSHLNAFVALDPKWCSQKVRTAKRRLRDRSDTARAVRPWVREYLDGTHPPVPGIKKFTQRQIALYLCGNDIERADNFQKRIWRPSRPVLHLAVAVDQALCSLGLDQNTFTADLASVELVWNLVVDAQRLEPMILGDNRFGVSASDMLRLEWIS